MNSLIESYRNKVESLRLSQIDDAWQSYEDNNFDWYYMECMQAGEVNEYYPDDLEDLREYSEFYLLSNHNIFGLLEEQGEWFGHFYYGLEQQRTDEMEDPCWFDHIVELDWQEEYELFCAVDFINDEESFDPWYDVQKEIKRCEKISRKGKKHRKDKKYHFRDVKQRQCKIEYVEWSYSDHVTFKHKRAEKVYTKEEFCEDAYYKWDVIASLEMVLYEDKTYEDLMLEDWEDYLYKGLPPTGCKVEAKDYQYCTYCGNKHYDCDCFQ